MRIAVIHFSRRKVAGAETYLESIVLALSARGHQVGFWHETDEPASCPLMNFPAGVTQWSVPILGVSRAVAALREWGPELLFVHGFKDDDLQESILELGLPAVFFSHNFYGTCISGQKAFALPTREPCARRFGVACCVLYYPRRCGGLDPRTMWHDYQTQARRLKLLEHYRRIVVASDFMAAEYARHALVAEVAPYWVNAPQPVPGGAAAERAVTDEARLVFVGRTESTKGGELLLDALPTVSIALGIPVICHFIGGGRKRAAWEQRAASLTARHPRVRTRFHGWLATGERNAAVADAHLLVVPSVWPEPFGLVGLEAGALGVPATAFDVGGISQWLQDGVSGTLAPGTPPRAEELAAAIVRALADPAQYHRLCQGAAAAAHERFTREKHLDILERIFASSIEDASSTNTAPADDGSR